MEVSAEQNADLPAKASTRFSRLAEQPLRSLVPEGGFFSGALPSIRDIYAHRHLWYLLTRRELKARYKDSVLGFLWTLVRPLVSLLIYYLAIGKVLGAERSIADFAVYVFAGLTAWTFFSSAVSGATSSLIANSGIIKKVYLPRELFPLTSITSSIVDFSAQLVILVFGALVIRGLDVTQVATWAPISFLLLLVWAAAIGLLLSAFNVYLRDVQYLVEVVLMLGFWLTPCVYSISMVSTHLSSLLYEIYLWNPATAAVIGFQRAFWLAGSDNYAWPDNMLDRTAILLIIGFVFLFIAQRIFAKLQRNFAQEL